MKKYGIIVLLILIINLLSSICSAYGIRYSSYNERELDEKLEEWTPEGWHTGFLQACFLEGNESLEFIIWHISIANNTPSINNNQLFAFSYSEEVLNLIWKSDIFEGQVIDISFLNMNNEGYDNINLILVEEQNGKLMRFLRSYDWNREFTQLVYPQDHLKNFLADAISIDFFDGDSDVEISVHTLIQEEPRKYNVETYCYKNGFLELEWEEIELRNTPQPVDISSPVDDEKDAPFVDFVQANGYGGLMGAYDLYRDGLYLLEIGAAPEEVENYVRYMVVQQESGLVQLVYKLDAIYNDVMFTDAGMDDLNLDGYIELVFEDTGVGGSLFYIVSLTPHVPQLISPVLRLYLENERPASLFYRELQNGPLELTDLNNDSVPEVGTTSDYNGEFAIQYWMWNDQQRVYIPYKMRIWDEETGNDMLIDNPE